MKSFELNDENFLLYAMKNYDNPECRNTMEFEEDLNRFVYLKRLFRRYHKTGELKERLILNHLITFYNVFGVQAATKMLFYKIEPELHYILKTFLVYLNYVPSEVGKDQMFIMRTGMDDNIIKVLRRI